MEVDCTPIQVHDGTQPLEAARLALLPDTEIDAYLLRRLGAGILEKLKPFCAVKVTESELNLLSKNPELLSESCVDALRQVAIRANSRNDVVTAYQYHRKAELVAMCVEKGSIGAFAKMLDDADTCGEFFDRVGPPPGYDDDYFETVAETYWDGDSLKETVAKQAFGSLSADKRAQVLDEQEKREGFTTGPRRFKPSERIGTAKQHVDAILEKYVPGFLDLTLDSPSASLGLEAIDEDTLGVVDHQHLERRHIISEFVHQHGGMKKFLNWIVTMLPHSRLELLSVASCEFFKAEHPLKDVISDRQAQLLVPELSDPHLLSKDDGQLLFEIMVKCAMGRENSFPKVSVASPAETSAIPQDPAERDFFQDSISFSPVVQELQRQYLLLRRSADASISTVLQWIGEQQDKYAMYVPALIYLEWTIEDAVIMFCADQFTPPQLQCVKERRGIILADFEEPVLMYRTRIIQLFLLSLIEKCLLETLPRPRPGRKRKRK